METNMEANNTSNTAPVEDVYDFNVEFEDSNKNGNKRRSARNSEMDDSDNMHTCRMCLRVFTSVKGLKRHMTVCDMHGIKVEQMDNGDANDENDNKSTYGESGNLTVSSIMRDMEDHPTCWIEPGKCDCCGEKIQTAHSDGDFKCELCNISLKKEKSLKRHVLYVHGDGEDLYDCSECQARCPDKDILIKHMKTHADAADKPVACPVCNKRFSRKYHLIRHNLQTGCDGRDKPTFPCQVCLREFNRKDNLREHLRAHAGQTKRKKVYTCEFCHETFQGNAVLNAHKKIHTGNKPHQCDLCDKRFPNSGAMKKHRRKHTGERPYECRQCFARFSAKETLNRHMRIHTGQKPHVCLFCGKSFIQKSQLNAHIFHHTGENGYTCETCGKSFNRRARLELHIKYVHEGAKPFDCDQCQKTFIRREDLLRHSVLHSGVKAHKCPICQKGFAIKSSLKIHLLTHTKEPPRSCDECGRAFIRQDCLLRHMRTKHREMLEEIMAEAEKKKIQAQLLAVAAASNAESAAAAAASTGSPDASSEFPTFLSNETLTESVGQLLKLLVEETTLKSFGWPTATTDKVLESVIKRCGHTPATTDNNLPFSDCLRENTKLLFTVVIDDSAVRTLLNNQTVDEVILHVLKLAKT